MSDGLFVAFDGPLGRSLAAPAKLDQDLPHVRRVIADVELAFDDLGHTLARPEVRGKASRFGAALEQRHQMLVVGLTHVRPATGSSGLSKSRPAFCGQRRRPSVDRLPMDTQFTRHRRFGTALFEQSRRVHSPALQCLKIPTHPSLIAHDINIGPL